MYLCDRSTKVRRNCVKRIEQYWIFTKEGRERQQTRSKYLFNELNNWLSWSGTFRPRGWFTVGSLKAGEVWMVTATLGSSFVYNFYSFAAFPAFITVMIQSRVGWLSRCEMMITSAIVCWSFDAQWLAGISRRFSCFWTTLKSVVVIRKIFIFLINVCQKIDRFIFTVNYSIKNRQALSLKFQIKSDKIKTRFTCLLSAL